jgi:hypothetical protein
LIGGAAFARHGLNTHVPKAHDYAEPFDVEGYVSRQKFVDLNKRVWGPDNYLLGYRVILEGRQYPVHGMFFPEMLQYDGHRSLPKDFDAALEVSEVVGGLAVLPVHMLAKTKLQAGRVKDVAGIIKAHIIASAEHHAVAEDPVWLQRWPELGIWKPIMPAYGAATWSYGCLDG